MRIPFLAGGHSPDDDPERRKLLVAEGRVPRPFPGPWTLRAVVRGDEEPLVKEAGPDADPVAARGRTSGAGKHAAGDRGAGPAQATQGAQAAQTAQEKERPGPDGAP
jgi:hypothetical protein